MDQRPVEVGIGVIPYADSLQRNRELIRTADEGGLRFVGIQDHPYQHHFFDTWSLIPTLLAETRRISFFTDVASLPLRPPAVMAKAAAALDVLSGGRFELGLVAAHCLSCSRTSGVRGERRARPSRRSMRRST